MGSLRSHKIAVPSLLPVASEPIGRECHGSYRAAVTGEGACVVGGGEGVDQTGMGLTVGVDALGSDTEL